MSILLDTKTYDNEPKNAWRKIKTKNKSLVFLSFVKSLASFREKLAQKRNVPRNRILRDDMILELASIRPKSLTDLKKSRLLNEESRKGATGEGILGAIAEPILLSEYEIEKYTVIDDKKTKSNGLTELFRVLLKANSEKWGVAQRLIASTSDLDDLANKENPEIPALHGWRRKVFGADALRLKSGEIALSSHNGTLKIVELK